MILTINFINENLDRVPTAEYDSFIAKWKFLQQEIDETRRGEFMMSANGNYNGLLKHVESKLTDLFQINDFHKIFISIICRENQVDGESYVSLSSNFEDFIKNIFDDYYLRKYLDKVYIDIFEDIMIQERNKIISLYS